LSWRVLNPRPEAFEAEDSNDASTAVLFAGSAYKLLTLADLGEKGQMRLAPLLGTWSASNGPLILKVSHHGSADQYPELIEAIRPEFAVISVGKNNSYGHPTDRTISLLQRLNSQILRTDELGSIALDVHSAAEGEVEVKVLHSG
jgi:competence protein ComEC